MSVLSIVTRTPQVESVWIQGLFDPDTDQATPPVSGLGTTGVLVANAQARSARIAAEIFGFRMRETEHSQF